MECFLTYLEDIEGRIDPHYYRKEFVAKKNLLASMRFNIYPLGKLITDISGGATPKLGKGYYTDDKSGVPFLRVQNISESGLVLDDLKYIKREIHNTLLKRSQLKAYDLVFTITGRIGNVSVIPKGFEGNINQHSVRFHLKTKIDETQIIPEYVAIYLNSNLGNTLSVQGATGGTRPALDYERVKSIQIPIPPPEIQNKIIDVIQSAYQSKRQKETEAQKLLDSIDDYVLGELDIPTPQSEDKQCFVVWENEIENRRIDPKAYTPRPKAILEVIGKSKYPARALKELVVKHIAGNWGEDPASIEPSEKYILCNVIRNTDFDNNYNLDLENVAQRLIPVESYERIKLRAGDILLEKSGGSPAQPVGRVALATKEHEGYAFSNFVQLLRINTNECLPEYLFTYLRVIYKLGYMEYIQNQTTGIRNLILEDFLSIPIPIPSDLTTQARIGNEVIHRMKKTTQLRREAKAEVEKAKAEVEKIILG